MVKYGDAEEDERGGAEKLSESGLGVSDSSEAV